MRLIPNVLLGKPPSSERRVHEALSHLSVENSWQAFHSLNCSEHAYKRWSEIDFLVMGSPGLFVLEVKGGHVSIQDGLWTFTDRWGREHTRSEGPFRQARSAMHAIEAALKERHGLAGLLRNTVFGFGVMLIDVDWDEETLEMPSEIVCDRMDFKNGQGVGKYLDRLISYWSNKRSNAAILDEQTLRVVRQKLRPEVDVYPPLSVRVGIAGQEMLSLTEEQYERLEVVDENPRVVVSGGAGTGKTFLMLQCARREASLGRVVLVVVESRILAAQLNAMERRERLYIHAYEDLERGGAPRNVDVLLVDEGQDLLFMDALAILADHLRGGLDDGRWRWFMDENRQSGIAGRREEDAERLLTEGLATGSPTRVVLRRNCRNTREIIQTIEAWTGAAIGRATLKDSLGVPILHEYDSADSLAQQVSDVVGRLFDDGIEADEVALIHPKGAAPFAISSLVRQVATRCVPLDVNTVRAGLRNRIVIGPVDRFKGLERPVVLAIGFDLADFTAARVSELYVATTRANFSLHLFVSPEVARELRKRARRGAS